MTGPRHLFRGLLSGLVPVLILAGCSGGTDAPTLQLQVIEAARETIAAKTAPKPQAAPLTRAVLNTLDGAFLEITREREDLTAYLYPSARAGEITVWRTETDETVTVRGGVLIATRGLGGDLLSTELRLSGSGLGPAPAGERVFHVLTADNKQAKLTLACEVTDLGPETIEVIELRHATRHLREHCEADSGAITNEYWIDQRTRLIRQSRQWAGPHIGYLRLRQITD